jgi:hypothetical protein
VIPLRDNVLSRTYPMVRKPLVAADVAVAREDVAVAREGVGVVREGVRWCERRSR